LFEWSKVSCFWILKAYFILPLLLEFICITVEILGGSRASSWILESLETPRSKLVNRNGIYLSEHWSSKVLWRGWTFCNIFIKKKDQVGIKPNSFCIFLEICRISYEFLKLKCVVTKSVHLLKYTLLVLDDILKKAKYTFVLEDHFRALSVYTSNCKHVQSSIPLFAPLCMMLFMYYKQANYLPKRRKHRLVEIASWSNNPSSYYTQPSLMTLPREDKWAPEGIFNGSQ